MKRENSAKLPKKQSFFDAELKRAFAVGGFSGTFCVVFSTFISFYKSSTAALAAFFAFFFISGSLFLLLKAAGKKISNIFLAAFIGIAVCFVSWCSGFVGYGRQRNALCNGEKQSARLVLTDDGRKTFGGYYIYPAKLEDEPFAGEITVVTRTPLENPSFTAVEGEFKFSAPEGKYVTTSYASSTVASVYLDTKKVSFSETEKFAFSKAVYAARKYVERKIEAVAKKESAFLKALILGRKQEMYLHRREALSDAGLSHIVAVSGLHISVFIAFISKLFAFVKNRFIRNITFIFAVFMLAAICGFTSSVVRASLMSTLAFSGNLFHRKSDSLNNLGFAALVIVVADPRSAVSASFLLSFGATLGIILFSEKFSSFASTEYFRLTRRYPKRFFRFFSGLFCTSLAAFLFTFPLLYYFFGKQSAISLLSNVICLPLVSFLYPCAVAAVLLEATVFLHPIAVFVGGICDKIIAVFIFLVFRLVKIRRMMGNMGLPGYAVSVVTSAVLYSFFTLRKRKRLRLRLPLRHASLCATAPVLTFILLITLFSVL